MKARETNGNRRLGLTVTSWFVAILGLLAGYGPASAAPYCEGSTLVCSDQAPILTPGEAKSCLCGATTFFDADVRGRAARTDFTSFDQILPPTYEPASTGYSESRIDAVISWAIGAPRTTETDEILYEAALRKASAHGIFGDDRLIRGLDPSYESVIAAESVVASRENLDSRVCHSAASPPTPVSPAVSCNVDSDCSAGQVCAAKRLSASGTYGAVQEYRRGERALSAALQHLGFERFRQLDEKNKLCGGAGCAARLLLHLGTQKARAQAERADLLWRQAIAVSGLSTEAPTCSVPAAAVGQFCSIHRDCDRSGSLGHCGASEREQGQILLREAAGEAAAEASAAQIVYSRLIPPSALATSSDVKLLQSSLGDIAGVETRSLTNATPFGLPADYVPLLSSVQEQYLNCVQGCTGSGCSTTYNAGCLLQLANGPNFLNVIEKARSAQTEAQTNAGKFADSVRLRTNHKDQLEQDFKRVINRLLGAACTPGTPECACPQESADRGECIVFQGTTWIAQGVRCDDPTDPAATCSVEGVDGEFERQLLAVRNAEVALDGLQKSLANNDEIYQGSIRDAAALRQIRSDECTQTEAAFRTARDSTSNALQSRHDDLKKANKCRWTCKLGKAFAVVGSIAAVAITGGAAIGPIGAGIASAIGVSATGATIGATGATIGTIAASGSIAATVGPILSQDNEKRNNKDKAAAQLKFDKLMNEISSEKELTLLRIKCGDENNPGTTDKIAEVSQDTELRKIEIARREIYQKIVEQQGAILDALTGSQQLLAELAAARDRYDEAIELDEIWSDAAFRNPQNYRAVALEQSLLGAERFRTAQLVTWMILRGVAYDRALPDFPVPQSFSPSSLLRIPANVCKLSACSGGTHVNQPCATDAQCGNGFVCQPTGAKAAVADSTGGCSLQAVFAARTVDDLEALIHSAYGALASPPRTLFVGVSECPGGVCTKVVRLRNIFGDPNLPELQRPLLGETLLQSPVGSNFTTQLDFGVSLSRGFSVCTLRSDGSCPPSGVANLSRADLDGGGPTTVNMWNARLMSVQGTISYDAKRHPARLLCRDPYSGDVANVSASACQLPGGGEKPLNTACGTGCTDTAGNPNQNCLCIRLLQDATTKPLVQLYQIEPGVVRTDRAGIYAGDDVVPRPIDSILRFRPMRGTLTFTNSNDDLDRFPILLPFGLKALSLADTLSASPPNINAKGVPVAGSRWQLRMDTTSLASSRYRRAFLSAIKDIELYFNFQGFEL